MEVLITSKTHKGHAACVGGLVLQSNRLVRLLNPGNWDQYADTELAIGDIWDIEFVGRDVVEPPHVEDVVIQRKKYIGEIGDISQYIRNSGVQIYHEAPTQIFGGRLSWTSHGSGYISRNNVPEHSVGFWICDQDLRLDADGKHYNYFAIGRFANLRRLPYVGFEPTVEVIPAGTLMRVSLARWWSPEDSDMEERCYLQLSGWYNISKPINQATGFRLDNPNDDLPF